MFWWFIGAIAILAIITSTFSIDFMGRGNDSYTDTSSGDSGDGSNNGDSGNNSDY